MRVVFISDTHGYFPLIPDGDVLVCSGDFLRFGTLKSLSKFAKWMKTLPHKHKVVVAGNHDLAFEDLPYLAKETLADSCVYLQDQSVRIDGIHFYGSPWQPWFNGWAFNIKSEEKREAIWGNIPMGVDVLITHGPPYGILDQCYHGERVGCKALLQRVKQVQPRIHAFGHIHEQYGQVQGGATRFINASICTVKYSPDNPPVVVDL